ncbi:hypothetical protein FSP39_004763 [Pinctada imbricata]|uniref:Uncharacterized protein n=2 Tax=cellular organisms TaxID=131567 RepID=A0AA88YPW3_PINIB|nr:hypothetical protein FSP39_004763 [Pinctada imbricata]
MFKGNDDSVHSLIIQRKEEIAYEMIYSLRNFPFARRCIGVSAKRDVRGRYDMSKRRDDQVSTLDAVEKLLMEKSSLENEESYEDYGDGWDFINGKEDTMENDYPSNILKKIIKRKSVNTDIISQTFNIAQSSLLQKFERSNVELEVTVLVHLNFTILRRHLKVSSTVIQMTNMDNDHIPVYSTKSIIQKSETEGIQNQDKTGTKANKQKPPPYEKKRTPDMGVRPGAQEE